MSTTTINSSTLPHVHSLSVIAPLMGVMLIGLVVVFGVGFSDMAVAHNAAHDMRHANAFPCH